MPVRRIPRHIEESLSRRLECAVFEPNGEVLWEKIRREADRFMLELFRQGALVGSKPEEAYFVKCDGETTTQTDIGNGIVEKDQWGHLLKSINKT